jgi:putative hydrolase of the HAD superfamily
MAKRPKAVVFDMDDVLCHYHFDRRLACLSEMTGVAPEVINKVIWQQGFDEDADRGLYSAEEYLGGFCERLGAKLSKRQWLEARAISIEPDEQVLNMARQIKQRAILALLSNNGPLLKESIDAVFPELVEIFGKRAYFSYEFAAAKPDPRVFVRLLERLQVKPQDTLFIDDTETYIKGATIAGLHTHHFRSASELRPVLESYSLLA